MLAVVLVNNNLRVCRIAFSSTTRRLLLSNANIYRSVSPRIHFQSNLFAQRSAILCNHSPRHFFFSNGFFLHANVLRALRAFLPDASMSRLVELVQRLTFVHRVSVPFALALLSTSISLEFRFRCVCFEVFYPRSVSFSIDKTQGTF